MMLQITIGLILFISVILVIVVLIQNSKGGGLDTSMAGAGSGSILGVKKTGDVLENTTWVLIGLMALLSVSTSFMVEEQAQGQDQGIQAEAPAGGGLGAPAQQGAGQQGGAQQGGQPGAQQQRGNQGGNAAQPFQGGDQQESGQKQEPSEQE